MECDRGRLRRAHPKRCPVSGDLVAVASTTAQRRLTAYLRGTNRQGNSHSHIAAQIRTDIGHHHGIGEGFGGGDSGRSS